MSRMHNVQAINGDDTYLYLTVDGRSYRVKWDNCSVRLAEATMEQRLYLEVSPSGYGIHWPLIDEDLAITPLLKQAEIVTTEKVG